MVIECLDWSLFILQRHYVPFIDHLRFRLTPQAEFERLVREGSAMLTELVSASWILYLLHTAFGGKVAGQTFDVARERSPTGTVCGR